MQRDRLTEDAVNGVRIETASSADTTSHRGVYGTQVLIAGRRKHWRDLVSAQVRQTGCRATSVDSAKDALAVLVLGLPVDVLVTDADLYGDLCCSRLAREARALRPNLRIIFARGLVDEDAQEPLPDTVVIPPGTKRRTFVRTVREAIAACA